MFYSVYEPTVIHDFESKEVALGYYNSISSGAKFFFDPEKNYLVGTLSVSTKVIRSDHKYHTETLKGTGLFIADSVNSVNVFMTKQNWKAPRGENSSFVRLYGNGPYGSLYQSKDVIEDRAKRYLFDKMVQRVLLETVDTNALAAGQGAIDIKTYQGRNPFKML